MARLVRRIALLAQLTSLLVLAVASGTVAAPGGNDADSGQRVAAIVVLHDDVDSRSAARDMERRHDGDVSFVYEHALTGFAGVFPEGRLDSMERDSRVDYVELDREVHAFAQELPTGIRRIFADDNAGIDIDGADDQRVDVDVAVIDTGIDLDHPDLNVAGSVDCFHSDGGGPPWARSYYCGDGGDDDNGHGTHVAGTVGALDNTIGVVGVAPGARMWGVKVLDSSGSGSISTVVAGIDWVTDNAGTIEVANMSLGCECSSDSLDTAISTSVGAGVAYAVAAGNDGQDAATFSPANHPDVLTVSALADFDGAAGGAGSPTCRSDQDDTLADFSNHGPLIDIAAPGVCIRSTVPGGGYDTYSGTSMASPHAAGALGLLASGGNDPTSASDVAALYDTATTAGNLDWTDDSGDGVHEPLLDVGDATVFAPTLVATSSDDGSTNSPPTADFTASCTDLTCDFDGTASSDGDGSVASYGWDLGDTTTATGSTVTHTYGADGTYTVTLTVTDDDGATDSTSQDVTVSDSTSGDTPATLTVASETYDQFGGKSRDKHLDVTIRVTDDGGSGVSGASVVMDLYRDGSLARGGQTATTDDSGYVTFSYRDIGAGCYAADITDVSKDGSAWDGSDPEASSC